MQCYCDSLTDNSRKGLNTSLLLCSHFPFILTHYPHWKCKDQPTICINIFPSLTNWQTNFYVQEEELPGPSRRCVIPCLPYPSELVSACRCISFWITIGTCISLVWRFPQQQIYEQPGGLTNSLSKNDDIQVTKSAASEPRRSCL